MNILMVSSYLPYPLFSGGHIRLYNIIKQLSKNHSVTLVCEKRDYQTQKDIEAVGRFCQEVLTVPRKKQWTIGNIIKSGFSLYPFLLVGHTNQDLRNKIIKELKDNTFDLIHVETFYVFQNLPQTTLPIVLAEQNIEHLVYKRFVEQAPISLRPFLIFDVLKIKYWEKKFWQKAAHIVVTSEVEKKLIGKSNAAVVPNGVDLKKYQISNIKYQISKKEKRILFIGDFRWIENKDAAEWLIKDIWPHFAPPRGASKGKPKIKLWIVGKEIPDSLKRLTNDESVIFDESAPDDTVEIFKKADLLLASIRIGGGTKFKILESMASGVPVITTTIGVEGLGARDDIEIFISDTADGLAKKALEVLQNKTVYEKIAKNARRLIEEKYDWKIIIQQLENAYQQVIV